MSGPLEPPADGSPYFPISERAASLAVIHVSATSPLLVIALAMFVSRIWLRTTSGWALEWQDYVMAVGISAAIVDFGFLLPQMFATPRLITHDEMLNARKYAFLAIPIWGIAMTFIKVSIAMMLLRIQPNVIWWRVFCFFVMALQIVYGVGNTFFILLQCRPLQAAWNPAVLSVVEGAECLPRQGIHIASNLGSGINIATDIMLSLAPTFFLWKLNRPLREKVLIGLLMAVGMVASVASIVKATLVKNFGSAEDAWALTNSIATWTALEQLLAMVASSAPFLKPMVQSVLHRMGLTLSDTRTAPSYGNRYHSMGNSQGAADSNRNKPRTTRKSKIVVTREVDVGDEDPFAYGGERGIPLEVRGQTNCSASSRTDQDSKSDKQEFDLVPRQAPRNGV